MICCAAAAVALGTGAMGWRRLVRFHGWRPSKQMALAAVVVGMITIAMAGLAEHLVHHSAHADGQALLTDLGAVPLCGGRIDRPTEIASIEE